MVPRSNGSRDDLPDRGFDIGGAPPRITILTRGVAVGLVLLVVCVLHSPGTRKRGPIARVEFGEQVSDIRTLALSHDGRRLSACGFDGSLMLWEVEFGRARKAVPRSDWWGLHTAISANGSVLATEN